MATLNNLTVGSDSDSSTEAPLAVRPDAAAAAEGAAMEGNSAPGEAAAPAGVSAGEEAAPKEGEAAADGSGTSPGGKEGEGEKTFKKISSESTTPTHAASKTDESAREATEGGDANANAAAGSSKVSKELTPREGASKSEQEQGAAAEKSAPNPGVAPPLDPAAVRSKRSSVKPSPAAVSPASREVDPNGKSTSQAGDGAEAKPSKTREKRHGTQKKSRSKRTDLEEEISLMKKAEKCGIGAGSPHDIVSVSGGDGLSPQPGSSPAKLSRSPRKMASRHGEGSKGNKNGENVSEGADGQQMPVVVDIPVPSVHKVFHTNRGDGRVVVGDISGIYTKRKRKLVNEYRTEADDKENSPQISPLTLQNVGRHIRESGGVHKGYTARRCYSSESSLFKSCVSLNTDPKTASPRKRSVRRGGGRQIERTGRALQRLNIPAYHRRLIIDMHQKGISERQAEEGSNSDDWLHTAGMGRRYSVSPERSARLGGHDRLPQRRYHSTIDGNRYGYSPRGASNDRLPERRRSKRGEDYRKEHTYKPTISKFAQALPRSDVPCHERLYSARPSVQRNKNADGEDYEAPALSPRLQEFVNNSSFELFRPHISKRARALEVEAPFYDRLHPSKEELARKRPEEPKPVSTPRVSTSRPISISPRLLARREPPPPESLPSFRPMITPRAKGVECSKPFYDRLHPSKEQRARKQKEEEPKSAPPRTSPRRAVSVSQRLLEPHQPPPYEKYDPSFRPEISPRARALERDGPFHKRLYLTPYELEEAHALHRRRQFESSCNFQPEIVELMRQNYDAKKVKRGTSKPVKAHRQRS